MLWCPMCMMWWYQGVREWRRGGGMPLLSQPTRRLNPRHSQEMFPRWDPGLNQETDWFQIKTSRNCFEYQNKTNVLKAVDKETQMW